MKTIITGLALVAALGGVAHANEGELIQEVESQLGQAIGGYQNWFEGEVEQDDLEAQAEVLVDVGRACSAAVAAALDGGVAASRSIDARGATITLGDANAHCARLTDAAQGVIDAARERAEAALAPFKKALKGDKLSLFMKYQGGFYGKGCKSLSSAKQLAKAKAWYLILEDDNGAYPVWTTRQYKFKGSTLVVDGKERTGRGTFPPAKGCP